MIAELDGPHRSPGPARLLAGPLAAWLLTLATTVAVAHPAVPTLAPPGPCGVSAEQVVTTFLARLGSDEAAVAECWAGGRLDGPTLAAYARSDPPTDVRLGGVHLSRRGARPLAAFPVWAHWRYAAAPREFASDGSYRWVLLERDRLSRWRIVEVLRPR